MVVFPTVGAAATAKKSAGGKKAAVTEIIELYTGNGTLEERIEGSGRLTRLAASLRAARRLVDKRTADSLYEDLVAQQKASGRIFGKNIAIVLQAFGAQSDAEYRALMNKLPVTITRTEMKNARGEWGIRTTYSINGRVRMTVFDVAGARLIPERTAPESSRAEVGGPSAAASQIASVDCQWYDAEEDFVWQGECATPQERDDAVTVYLAVDADVEDAKGDVDSAVSTNGDWCDGDQILDGSYMCVDPMMRVEKSAAVAANFISPFYSASYDGFADPTTSVEPPVNASGHMRAVFACYSQGLAFAGSVITYGWRLHRLLLVVDLIAPPAGALAEGVLLFAAAGLAAAGGAVAVVDCIRGGVID